MKNFKVEVSKWLEKYNLIRKAESESLLKDMLHKEWFSVLSIQTMGDIEVDGNKFYFEIIQNWELKVWTIVSKDIFKAYVKIKDNLKFDLKYIYLDKDTSLNEKEKIIHELHEQYRIYLDANKKEIQKKEEIEKDKIKVVEEAKIEDFHMKKELDEVYEIITKVMQKLRYFIELPNNTYLDFEKKEKLKDLHNTLVKLKNSTNITKLRQIWELALTKVWELELKILESTKNTEAKKLLWETNKLLKEVWSKMNFVPKEDDIWYIIKTFLRDIAGFLKPSIQKKQKFSIDTSSSSYLKTKLLIEKYEKKLKILNKEKKQKFIIYIIPSPQNNKIKENFYLREKVIKQNLVILKSRLTGKTYSYTKIVKWYYTFLEKILGFIYFLKVPLFFLIFFYWSVFLFLNILNFIWLYQMNINFYGMFYFLFLNIAFLLLSFVRWFFSLSFNIVILSFLFIFWVINF